MFVVAGSIFFIRSFYEVIIWGFFGDALYGTHIASPYNFSFLMSLTVVTLFFVIEHIKKEIRVYEK